MGALTERILAPIQRSCKSLVASLECSLCRFLPLQVRPGPLGATFWAGWGLVW